MNILQLVTIRDALDVFVAQFADCIKTKPSRRHLHTYISGQLGDLPRKSVEPIALDAGVPPRSLQEFLSLHRWDHEKVRRRLQELVMERHADDAAIAVFDETSFQKKGEKTAGVQRQYCGASGKTDNCVVSVHLGYATENFHTLVDADLFLPKGSWSDDRERCRQAQIPEDVTHRPKPSIAVELLDRALQNGMRFKYATADELYGRSSDFRHALGDRGLTYVVEIPCNHMGWTKDSVQTKHSARRVDELWQSDGAAARDLYHIKDTTKGPLVWEFQATRFHSQENNAPGQEGWLLIGRNVLENETKYFLSNASADTPVEAMLHVAFSRWHVEKLFQES